MRGRAWERRELLLRTAPFAAITVLAFVTVPLGGLPTDGLLLGIAIGLTVLVALSVAALPWARLPTAAVVAPPFIGLAVVALLRQAQGGSASGYGGLVLISVLWLALYGTRTQLLVLCVAVVATFVVPILVVGAPDYPESEWRRAILTTALSLFVGLVTQSLVRQVRERAAEARERAREDRRREAYLRAVMDSAAEGIVAIDAGGCATFVNPSAARMFGYSAEELEGRQMHELVHHSHADGTPYPLEDCPTLKALEEGVESIVSDEVYWRKDGTSFPVEYRSTPMIADGEKIGVVNTFVDISERLAVQRVKDEFVSLVSHELRTPLTSIRGSLGLMQGGVVGELPDDAQEMLAIAISNADRLVRLINDILDVERIESGKAPMEARECNLSALMESTRDLLLPAAEADGVTLDVKPVDAPLEADPDRIIQTLVNLVGNAIKFSPDGGVVSVGGERRNARVRVVVSDQGPGISPEMRDSIFDRFAQISTGDARNKGGSGLGLAIARGIVEQHGGRIWVEPAEGGGSAFLFELPVSHHAPEPRAQEPTPTGDRLGALIVEDDHDLAQVLATSLTRHGVTTRVAGDAEDAIALLDSESPELIVLDLMLPGSPGTDVIAHLRDEDRDEESAIVVYTGLDLNREELAELRGFADVVTKSRVSSEEFEELLLAVLDRLRSPSPQPAD